jgi:hypothetical protein
MWITKTAVDSPSVCRYYTHQSNRVHLVMFGLGPLVFKAQQRKCSAVNVSSDEQQRDDMGWWPFGVFPQEINEN